MGCKCCGCMCCGFSGVDGVVVTALLVCSVVLLRCVANVACGGFKSGWLLLCCVVVIVGDGGNGRDEMG